MIQIEMEMADKCSECRFQTDYYFCSAMPKNFCGNTLDEGKPDWCPLKNADGWISVKDRMPDSNHVLARCEIRGLYKSKRYICVAFYAKKNSISVGNCFDDEICCEYDEETDEYYLKEGWYEVIHNWDEYGSVVIGDFVTHWMPLPSTEGLNEA